IVRIARERMKLDWDGSGMKRQWMPYFAAYPESAGLLVVDMLERRVRLIRMDWGEAYVHGE
ncbi:DNA-binding protein, partial [Paenibacillus thiaminolyticus]|nr:DNA-binding protein [Paenibacillus thiaminolyticus]